MLKNKHILVGVTGSIAAYKSADLVRRLREAGAMVRVVMTENAKRFITPLTMQAVSGYPVHELLFDVQAEAAMSHIELARWADMILIAPASANFIARLANGYADDLLTTLCLATHGTIVLAPAMNQNMWNHTLTQHNVQALCKKNFIMLETAEGSQACGEIGPGRMLESVEIVKKVARVFSTGKLAKLKVLVTAGPTHEAIDPVRFITNGSSGKMGYALAEAAREAGAEVTLVSGPVNQLPPEVNIIRVVTACEMYDVVMQHIAQHDIFLAVAAVSDYRSQSIANHKIHKKDPIMQLTLERNPDIVSAVGQLAQKPYLVGFAAETEDVVARAKAKRQHKNMNIIIANHVKDGMGQDDNVVSVISKSNELSLPRLSKSQLARQLIGIIAEDYHAQTMEGNI